MPCYDGRENERQILCTYEHEARIRKDCRHNSEVAEILCWTLTNMTHGERATLLYNNRTLRIWWAEHQERDAAKRAKKRRT
ncbi:hypothetical protein D3C81_1476790 [compost metagenome]